MKRAFLLLASIFVCMTAMPVFSSEVDRIGTAVKVGNDRGDSALASGKSVASISQGDCKYSLALLENQHVQFHSPDAVFLESKIIPKDEYWPHLVQAEMSAGYDWSFKENNNFKSKWFGLMCESAENFGLLRSDQSKSAGGDSPELQFVKEANDLKCPATLTEKGWVPNVNAGRPEDYVFRKLSGANWSGFMFGFKSENRGSMSRINFCLVHDGDVLLGSAISNSKPSWIDEKAFEEIESTLRTVTFTP
ncbi:hypothetical protein [Pseudomonas frederiksbergensis]|nr:hypothetical protein [Pseudomonas frederiksbergensis]